MRMFYGPQENEGMFHKNGFDRLKLARTLEKAGFKVVFYYSPYPIDRLTPSMLLIAEKK